MKYITHLVSHDPSKIILIWWFAAQETFLYTHYLISLWPGWSKTLKHALPPQGLHPHLYCPRLAFDLLE